MRTGQAIYLSTKIQGPASYSTFLTDGFQAVPLYYFLLKTK